MIDIIKPEWLTTPCAGLIQNIYSHKPRGTAIYCKYVDKHVYMHVCTCMYHVRMCKLMYVCKQIMYARRHQRMQLCMYVHV